MYNSTFWIGIFFLGLCLTARGAAVSDPLLPVWAEIRTEATRSNSDPIGRPLPLITTWQPGIPTWPTLPSFDPNFQIGKVDAGSYIMVSFPFPAIGTAYGSYSYPTAFTEAKNRNLPICFNGTQWEQNLYTQWPYYYNAYATNPCVYSTSSVKQQYLDPMGVASNWEAVGTDWVSSSIWGNLQALYPNPPQVLFLSNNEAKRMVWSSNLSPTLGANSSKRFVDTYGTGQTGEFKRQFIGDKWIILYDAMLDKMRAGLATWNQNQKTKFIAYEAFGNRAFRRFSMWGDYSLAVNNRIDPSPLMWEGGSPSYYTDNWDASVSDYWVHSPQVECMNWVFMQNEALQLNPNFWFELSIWDGNSNVNGEANKIANYVAAGQIYRPGRYAGMVQYGMWINRPRSVREFRLHTDRRDCNGPPPSGVNLYDPVTWTNTGYTNEQFFTALCDSVNKVHTSPTLRSFWRKGTLVQNTTETHPYQDASFVPVGYDDATINASKGGRWFMLTCDKNPPRNTWSLSTQLTVYSLALVQGTAPNRQWLVYAFAPLNYPNLSNVGITLPGYGLITVTVPYNGQFWVVDEVTHTQSAVLDYPPYSTLLAYNVRGRVVLGDYFGDNTTVPVTVQLRGTNTRTDQVNLDANGNFSLANVPQGTYSVWIKASHWLARLTTGVAVGINDVTDLGTVSLVNGDVDANNAVTSSDIAVVLSDMDTVSAIPNGSMADLDGDGEVTSSDLALVILKMDLAGDS